MNKLPNDISAEVFGEDLLNIRNYYGSGVLSKVDLEADRLHALQQSSERFADADSYERPETLRIADQNYRSISLNGRSLILRGLDLGRMIDSAGEMRLCLSR